MDKDILYVADQRIVAPNSPENPAIICSHPNDSLDSWLKIQNWRKSASERDRGRFDYLILEQTENIRIKAKAANLALTFDAYAVVFNPNLNIDENNPKLIVMDFDLVRKAEKNFALLASYNYINAAFYIWILNSPTLKNTTDLLPNKSSNSQFLAATVGFLVTTLFTNKRHIS